MKNRPITIYQKGYTLLFAVLTAALVLGVAVFILSISRGQYLLASTARESTYAIYAADSGIECASKAVSTVDVSTTSPAPFPITCAGKTKTVPGLTTPSNPSPYPYNQYSSSLYMDIGNSRCVKLVFTKGMSQPNGAGYSVLVVDSSGYNYCSYDGSTPPEPTGPDSANPKVVERAMRLTLNGQ